MFKRLQFVSVSAASALLILAAPLGHSEDIDIFVGGTGTATSKPNVLFVLDNTSNWSRNDQHWQPQGTTQGQAEVRAIRNALSNLTNKVNVGLMMYSTVGGQNDNGYVRHALRLLDSGAQTALTAKLDRIYDHINNSDEKRQAGAEYGYLFQDVYNYLSGRHSLASGDGTPPELADSDGYATLYSQFRSPLSDDDLCADTYVVFIGNPQSSGPDTDDSANSSALRELVAAAGGTTDRLAGQGSGTAPIPIPKFTLNRTSEDVELGYSPCYNKQATCTKTVSTVGSNCLEGGYTVCTCLPYVKTPNVCSSKNDNQYMVQGSVVTEILQPTGEYDMTSGVDWNLDDWAKFMYVKGVPVPGATQEGSRARVITYAIDVFNKKQNMEHTGLMMSTAMAGGGRYFFARNQDSLEGILNTIISEIISVNSTFASASLPISATNRAQNENQVFIGMFRPAQFAAPRWFGNLKRYQLKFFGGDLDLADRLGNQAVNRLSGFVTECASSYWTQGTQDSDDYWFDLGVLPDPRSLCGTATHPYSDDPDGPFVEKGAAGQVLRNSDIDARKVYTLSSGALTNFTALNTGLDGDLVSYTRGKDVDNMDEDSDLDEGRPTIHGDIVHSRPLPINYGSSTGVTVFYGTNDGTLRAVNAADGTERWAFIAPEHFDKLERLRKDLPLVAFPEQNQAANPLPKDYFFDGSFGQVIRYNDEDQVSAAWIFPTMRRGGRMVYGFDVTTPGTPSLLWRKGCPNPVDDTGCTEGLSGLGQTWSIPNAGYVDGNVDGGGHPLPVLIMGGGYDACEDHEDYATLSTACGTESKGRGVYVLDAASGAVLKTFVTDRAVPADVSLVDLDDDNIIDVAYAVDTGGNLYRIKFEAGTVSSKVNGTILKIAQTQGANRKFLYGPAVMAYRDHVYLAFGSGNREQPLSTDYPYASSVQDRFYMFLDRPREDPATVSGGTYPFNLDSTTTMLDVTADPGCNGMIIGPGVDRRGWFMNLPNRGEQTVTNALIVAGMATFSTSRPGGTAVGGVCARPIGIAAGYWVNLFTGSGAIGVEEKTCGGRRSSELAGGGLPPAPVLATVPVDGKPTTVVIGAPPRDGSIGTPISPQEVQPAISNRRSRLFWSSDVDR
ncbi:putative type 4 fimbrial biogenesis pily1-related protein signal peptide [Thiocapsa sp. KS1]|nr:PilC/PilY family type IV pilus protein [Thiocapsa sp. KS1]CRI67319.1 putative type 4 fimbrial biogenesis pily1-related protein signal peptide [Thiocapsa sp. KS1]